MRLHGKRTVKAYVMQLVLVQQPRCLCSCFRKHLLHLYCICQHFLLTYTFLYFCKEKFVVKCSISIKNQWFADIQKKQLCDYDMQEASTYISHFTVDVKTIEEDYIGSLLSVIQDVIVGAASLGAILTVHYTFVIAICFKCLSPIFVSNSLEKAVRKDEVGGFGGQW